MIRWPGGFVMQEQYGTRRAAQTTRLPIVRTRSDFDVTVSLNSETFMSTINQSQRNWVLERTVDELVTDLQTLGSLTKRFVRGSTRTEIAGQWETTHADYASEELSIAGQQVMQRWETPLMKAMAEIVTGTHGDVLEIGFGMGISADFIQQNGTKTHTIIECNADVLSAAREWERGYTGRDIYLVEGRWQDAIDQSKTYDAVLFDTYPLNESEFLKTVVESVTFAEHFFPTAAQVLRPGGVFTYYTNEIDSFSRRHQRSLFQHFRSITLSVVRPREPPNDCNYWWADSMAVVRAVK